MDRMIAGRTEISTDGELSELARLSDEDLVACARSGRRTEGAGRQSEAGHFEELVRRFQAPLLRLLMRRLPRRADAEDILQETFLRAYEKLEQYESRWPFATW